MGHHLSKSKANSRNNKELEEYSPAGQKRHYDKMNDFTIDEKQTLKSSWRAISDQLQMIGVQTFIEMFKAHPDSQDVFHKFRARELIAMEHSPELMDHGERVMGLVDVIIKNIDDKRQTWEALLDLGKRHFAYGALPMYLDLMGPHFVIAMRNTIGGAWYEALEYHWLALFEMMVYVMKYGWNLKRVEEQRKARSVT